MSKQLVLFFSPGSEQCIDIWKLLKTNNILNTLIKINIDDPQNSIPAIIGTVPSLLIRGQPVISGKDNIMKYFNITKQSVEISNNTTNDTNNTNNTSNDSKTLPPINDEVPFTTQNESMFLNTNELGNKWSDNYSFLNSDVAQKHSFEFINNDTNDNSSRKSNADNNKKSMLEQKMEKLMNSRNEIKPFKRI
tara:strand:+ start:1832 stop:2407 length:576 start_codon:yes stop_codon:yes gene_type:complete